MINKDSVNIFQCLILLTTLYLYYLQQAVVFLIFFTFFSAPVEMNRTSLGLVSFLVTKFQKTIKHNEKKEKNIKKLFH